MPTLWVHPKKDKPFLFRWQKKELHIGHSSTEYLNLTNPFCSPQHALIYRKNNKYFIRDLKSKNGTFVNGQHIKGDTLLKNDDEILIGSALIRFGSDFQDPPAQKTIDEAGNPLLLRGVELKRNYLEPEISIFSGFDIATHYYLALDKIFSKAYEKCDVQISAVVTPSFEPEYVIGVRLKGKSYYAYKLTSEKQIWQEYYVSKEKETIVSLLNKKFEIIESEAEISEETFTIIEKSWKKMIREQKHRDDDVLGLDGTTYHFSHYRATAARAWSPSPDSHTGYLVKITELLGRLPKAKNKLNHEKSILRLARILNESINRS